MRANRMWELAVALGVVAAVAIGGCTVSGGMLVTTTPVVYREPPPPQPEPVADRPGFVWVRGRWDLRDERWVWIGGHWERARIGHYWQEGRWERRGGQWHWIEGGWSTAGGDRVVSARVVARAPVRPAALGGMYPTSAPPPPRAESYGRPRPGYLWVAGRWDWRDGQWTWLEGRWERARPREAWVAGRWELQGNYYVWIEGRWDVVGR